MVSVSCEKHGSVIILSLEGEFCLESIDYTEIIWNEQIAKRPAVIGINLQKIKFIDSSAIGILAKFLHNAMKLHIEMVLFNLSDAILSVFQTAKLGNFFTIMTGSQFKMKYLK